VFQNLQQLSNLYLRVSATAVDCIQFYARKGGEIWVSEINKIAQYSYNKTNEIQQFLKFIFGINLYVFRTVSLSIIRSLALYTLQWYMSHKSADSLLAGLGWNILIPLASCQQTCVTYTIAVCTVLDS